MAAKGAPDRFAGNLSPAVMEDRIKKEELRQKK
jgi:hypothetical protein